MIKLIITLLLLLTLCACNSQHQQPESDFRQPITPETKIKTAKINAHLGLAYLERKNVLRARKKLLLALSQAPNIPETWYSMAYFLENTGDIAEARKHYLKALALAPNNSEAKNNYGTFLCRNGEYRQSIKYFLEATKDVNYPNPADAYENAGLCSLKIKSLNRAAYYFKRAIMHDPYRPVSIIQLAEIDFQKGNFRNARIRLHQYLAIASPSRQSSLLEHSLKEIEPLDKA